MDADPGWPTEGGNWSVHPNAKTVAQADRFADGSLSLEYRLYQSHGNACSALLRQPTGGPSFRYR